MAQLAINNYYTLWPSKLIAQILYIFRMAWCTCNFILLCIYVYCTSRWDSNKLINSYIHIWKLPQCFEIHARKMANGWHFYYINWSDSFMHGASRPSQLLRGYMTWKEECFTSHQLQSDLSRRKPLMLCKRCHIIINNHLYCSRH